MSSVGAPWENRVVFGLSSKKTLPTPDDALAGRPEPLPVIPDRHVCSAHPLEGPWPEGTEVIYVAMGCFWGAERIFWRLPGVVTTAAGYMGGLTPNPTYEETCTGRTGHTEAVLVAYDPADLRPSCCSRRSGRTTTRPRATARATTSAPSTARRSTGPPPSRSGGRGDPRRVPGRSCTATASARSPPRCAPPRRPATVLLRRGLPPAVPPQEPRRLLQPRPQRDDLPGRSRPAGPAAQPDLGAPPGQRAGRLTAGRGARGQPGGRSTQSVPTWRGEAAAWTDVTARRASAP